MKWKWCIPKQGKVCYVAWSSLFKIWRKSWKRRTSTCQKWQNYGCITKHLLKHDQAAKESREQILQLPFLYLLRSLSNLPNHLGTWWCIPEMSICHDTGLKVKFYIFHLRKDFQEKTNGEAVLLWKMFFRALYWGRLQNSSKRRKPCKVKSIEHSKERCKQFHNRVYGYSLESLLLKAM